MKRLVCFLVCFLILFISSSIFAGTTYYAAPTPTGSGTTCSNVAPCTVSYALNTKMTSGDDLVLQDGIYDDALDMIIPPVTLGGTSGDHIDISCANEGEAVIDGTTTGTAVYLGGNDYFDLSGFNAHGADKDETSQGRVVWIYNSDHVTVKRVIAWDGDEAGNSYILYTSCATEGGCGDILFEDCAGWGGARKIFSGYKVDGLTFRRCFFRWTGQGVQNPYTMGLSSAYYCTNTITENCIGTWDETDQSQTEGLNRYGIFGIDYTSAAGSYKILGNIAYILNSQDSQGVARHFAYGTNDLDAASALEITNNIAYTDRADIAPFQSTKSTATISYLTAIGGAGVLDDAVQIDLQTGTVDYVIQTNSTKDGVGVNGNDFDYVWFYNNNDDYDGDAPAHMTTGSDPDLIGNCGNILQYECTDNIPEVSGHDVGAKIQYRYEDGVLSGTDLWPWPMNDRIASAMEDSGYDAHGGLDGNGSTDLTDVIFSLGGGSGWPPAAEAAGTIYPGGCQESEVVSGGKTIIITLSSSQWESDIGTDCANTTALIQGFDSNKSEATGWNDLIRDSALTYSNITRDSATQVTVTLPAVGSYDISENETITLTIPSSSITTDDDIVATPTFQISVTLSSPENLSIFYDSGGLSTNYDSNGVNIE